MTEFLEMPLFMCTNKIECQVACALADIQFLTTWLFN